MSEPRTPFVFKELQRNVAISFTEAISELVRRDSAGYFDNSNSMKFQHGARWETPANELGDKSGEMVSHSVEGSLALAEVVKGDPKIIFENINGTARAITSSIERMLFSKIIEVTAKTGNVVNAADHKNQLEAFAASLEDIEMTVDEDGSLNLPNIFIHPTQEAKLLKEIEEAPAELHERIEHIKAKKLKDATQKEAERKARFERREK